MVSVKISFLLVATLLFVSCDACIDLLVRSFNELFSPIIETSDLRRERAHDVDELTHFYKKDVDGSLVLNDKIWLPSNLYWRKPNRKQRQMVGSLFKQLELPVARSEVDESELTSPSSATNRSKSVEIEADIYPHAIEGAVVTEMDDDKDADNEIHDEYDIPEYHPRGAYVPGKRPLVDFIIRLLEMFQVTGESKFITSRTTDTNHAFASKNTENNDLNY